MKHGGDIYNNRVELDFSVNLNPLGTPDEITAAIRHAQERISCYPEYTQNTVRRMIGAALHFPDMRMRLPGPTAKLSATC